MIEKGQIYWCSLDPVKGHEQGLTRPVVDFAGRSGCSLVRLLILKVLPEVSFRWAVHIASRRRDSIPRIRGAAA